MQSDVSAYEVKSKRNIMDLFHDSLLFAFVYYRLCVLNYKYPVVAVVGL